MFQRLSSTCLPSVRVMFRRILATVPRSVWVVAMWAVLFLPHAARQAMRFEEGRRALLARDVLEEGRWMLPRVCGVRYVNKPPMLVWLIVGASYLTGGVNEWAVRLPSLVAVLAAGLSVWAFGRKTIGPVAATVAAAVLFLTPAVLQKSALGETDALVMACSFAAFALWWLRFRVGPVGWLWWFLCGVVLAGAAFAKGPPVLLYFALAVGITTLLMKRPRELLGLVACLALAVVPALVWAAAVRERGDLTVWSEEMLRARAPASLGKYLIGQGEVLGGIVLGCGVWAIVLGGLAWYAFRGSWRRGDGELDGRKAKDGERSSDRGLLLALFAYAAPMIAVLLVHPGAQVRYALPIVPVVAVAGGWLFERIRTRAGGAANVAVVLLMLAGLARAAYVAAVLPHVADEDAREVAAQFANLLDGGPFYKSPYNGFYNVVFYLNCQMEEITLEEFLLRGEPATVLLDQEEVAALSADGRVDIEVLRTATFKDRHELSLARLAPRTG